MIKYIKQLEKYTCYFTDDHLYYKEMMVSLIREDLLFKVIIQGDNMIVSFISLLILIINHIF